MSFAFLISKPEQRIKTLCKRFAFLNGNFSEFNFRKITTRDFNNRNNYLFNLNKYLLVLTCPVVRYCFLKIISSS